MSFNKLPDQMQLGRVHLIVADLERSITFYRRSLGLVLTNHRGATASLGAGQRELLRLTERPNAGRIPWRTGLYHFALLVPSREDLGYVLRNLIATNSKLTGGADHLVSEAIYLDDPDGNGIEIYSDRPREDWTWSNGMVTMDTLPLDYDGILAEARGTTQPRFRINPGTLMGHIHLHVAQLDEAITFYRDVAGFDLQLTYGATAAFLAAGGYHHHIGVNTWAGVGAPPAPEGTVGLRDFVIELPDMASINEMIGRLQRAHISYESSPDGLYVNDPSQNRLLIVQQ